jgi:hypothetical protein
MSVSAVSRKAYANYYKDADLVLADCNWASGVSDDIHTKDDSGQKIPAPGTFKGKPVFEDGVLQSMGLPSYKTWRRHGGTMIAKSDNWTALIPGGFRDGPTPNKMNPVSFDIGGYSALMGLVHIIAIPNQRIANCVNIVEDDIPLLEEGMTLLKTAFNLLADGGKDEIGSVRWILSQDGTIKMNDGSEKSVKLVSEDFIPECRENFQALQSDPQSVIDNMEMEVTCHADTMASIRKLHLHGFSKDFKTVAWQKMEEKARSSGYDKNTLISDVIAMAKSGETQRMKDSVLMPPPLVESVDEVGLSRQSSAAVGLSRQSSVTTQCMTIPERPMGNGWNDDSEFSQSV